MLIKPRCEESGHQVGLATKSCNIFGSTVLTLLHDTLLAHSILKWSLGFWKICAPLIKPSHFGASAVKIGFFGSLTGFQHSGKTEKAGENFLEFLMWHCVVGRPVLDILKDHTAFEMSGATIPAAGITSYTTWDIQHHRYYNIRSCTEWILSEHLLT